MVRLESSVHAHKQFPPNMTELGKTSFCVQAKREILQRFVFVIQVKVDFFFLQTTASGKIDKNLHFQFFVC